MRHNCQRYKWSF